MREQYFARVVLPKMALHVSVIQILQKAPTLLQSVKAKIGARPVRGDACTMHRGQEPIARVLSQRRKEHADGREARSCALSILGSRSRAPVHG